MFTFLIIVVIILGMFAIAYPIVRYLDGLPLFGSKESQFKREKCPAGEKHNVIYIKPGEYYQTMYCQKCGKHTRITI